MRCWLIPVVVLSCGSLHAHGLDVAVYLVGDDLLVTAHFDSSTPAVGARVKVFVAGANGGSAAPAIEADLDLTGSLRTPLIAGDLHVVVSDGAGHRAERLVARSAIAAARKSAGDSPIRLDGTGRIERLPRWGRIVGGVVLVFLSVLVVSNLVRLAKSGKEPHGA